MSDMKAIFENVTINSWVKHFLRSPHQANKPHETDAELIEIPGDPNHYLAVTIDTVVEEITLGIYKDPYTMGWITVMASLSDLAAVGAEPLGLVIAVSIDPGRDKTFTARIAQGMEDACRALKVFIIGGDTNETPTISLTGCALGLVPRRKFLSRRGCKPGDAVFITEGMGIGNALGLVRLWEYPDEYFPEEFYRPVANLDEGRLLRDYASCSMDTSDGLLTTLDQLMRMNGFGFAIDCDWEKILAPEVWGFCNRTKTPHWLMTAGPHGEFKLVFTVPEERIDSCLTAFQSEGLTPIRIGTVQKTPVVSLILTSGQKINIDMTPLRNLLSTVEGDLQKFLTEFRAAGKKWGLE